MEDDKLIACICEGSAESVIINKLLDAEKLKFSRSDLLDNEVIRCRSAKNFEDKYLSKRFVKKITVYRILDSRKENFKLRKVYKPKVDVINVITAPEIEMLVIISEGKYADFTTKKNSKSYTKPSEYCKNILRFSSVKTEKFISKYFSNIDILINAITEYKRLSNIPKNEICLADIIRPC